MEIPFWGFLITLPRIFVDNSRTPMLERRICLLIDVILATSRITIKMV